MEYVPEITKPNRPVMQKYPSTVHGNVTNPKHKPFQQLQYWIWGWVSNVPGPEAADIGRPKLFGKKPDWEMILVFHKAESRNM